MTKLKLERLECREVPAWVSWEGYVNPIAGYDGPCMETGGDFNGDGTADAAFVPAEGGGGSIRVVIKSGGTPGTPLVYDYPGGPGRDPSRGSVIFDRIINDPSFRGGAVVSPIRSPDGSHAILAVSPGVGGGPIVNLLDLKENTITAQLVLDINYRGGLRFVNLPPLDGVGHPDSLVMATPAPGGGGGAVATIFDGRGTILRSFFTGPSDDRSGNYQPIPAGAGVIAPDGSGMYGSYFAAPDVAPFFVDINGIRRERDPQFNTGGGAA